jgi:PadR family transcriptional regulator, regulatory protein PadR
MPKGDFLGEFEIYVMLSLSHLDPDAYGVTIRQEITSRTGREIAIGAVYATLSRLEEKGLVAHTLSDPLPVPGGRTRKHFVLTPAGVRALDHATRMLARMMQGWRARPQHQ